MQGNTNSAESDQREVILSHSKEDAKENPGKVGKEEEGNEESVVYVNDEDDFEFKASSIQGMDYNDSNNSTDQRQSKPDDNVPNLEHRKRSTIETNDDKPNSSTSENRTVSAQQDTRPRALSNNSTGSTEAHLRLYRTGSFDMETMIENEDGTSSTQRVLKSSGQTTITNNNSTANSSTSNSVLDVSIESTTSSPTRHLMRSPYRGALPYDPPLPASLAFPLTNQQERDEIERIVSNISSSTHSSPPHDFHRYSRPHYSNNVSASSEGVPELLRREGYVDSPSNGQSFQHTDTPPTSPGFMRRSNLGDSGNTGWSTSSSIFDRRSNYMPETPPRAHASNHIPATSPPTSAHQPTHRMSVSSTPPAEPAYVSQYSQLGEDFGSGSTLGGSGRSHSSTAGARLSGSTAVVAAMKALQNKIGLLESERDAVLEKCSALEMSLGETKRDAERRMQETSRSLDEEQHQSRDMAARMNDRTARAEERANALEKQIEFIKSKARESDELRVDAMSRASVLERQLEDLKIRLQRVELMHANGQRIAEDSERESKALKEALLQMRQRQHKTAGFVQGVLELNETLVAQITAMQASIVNGSIERGSPAGRDGSTSGRGTRGRGTGRGRVRTRFNKAPVNHNALRPTRSSIAKRRGGGVGVSSRRVVCETVSGGSGGGHKPIRQQGRGGNGSIDHGGFGDVARELTMEHLNQKSLHEQLVRANLNQPVPFVLGKSTGKSHSLYVQAQHNLADTYAYGAKAATESNSRHSHSRRSASRDDDEEENEEEEQQQQQQQQASDCSIAQKRFDMPRWWDDDSAAAHMSEETAAASEKVGVGSAGIGGGSKIGNNSNNNNNSDIDYNNIIEGRGGRGKTVDVLGSVREELNAVEQALRAAQHRGDDESAAQLAERVDVKQQQFRMLERYMTETPSHNKNNNNKTNDIHDQQFQSPSTRDMNMLNGSSCTPNLSGSSPRRRNISSAGRGRERQRSVSPSRTRMSGSGHGMGGSGNSFRPRSARSPVRIPEAYDKKVRTLQILQQFREEEARSSSRLQYEEEEEEIGAFY